MRLEVPLGNSYILTTLHAGQITALAREEYYVASIGMRRRGGHGHSIAEAHVDPAQALRWEGAMMGREDDGPRYTTVGTVYTPR